MVIKLAMNPMKTCEPTRPLGYLSFIERCIDTTQPTPTAEVDHYLRAVAALECDLLTWWRKRAR